jgi:methylglutaconyl-CoA hydratase
MNELTSEMTAASVIDGVGHLTLRRPESRNALSPELAQTLIDAISALSTDESVRVVVLGAEGPAFCAGADLTRMAEAIHLSQSENECEIAQLSQLFQVLYECPKPTIARVQGPAYGGGIGLIAACDLSIAVSSAKFCFSEVRLGLLPAIISPYVVRRMAPAAVQRYFLTAEAFTAEEAARQGLLTGIALDEPAMDQQIDAWTAALKRGDPGALAAAKRLRDLAAAPMDDALRTAMTRLLAQRRIGEEGVEGVKAFLEKRPPGWLA